jgi:hypothetical protein
MRGAHENQNERWIRLCEQAAVEHDHQKLLKLVSEIARMLDEKQQRVNQYSHSRSATHSGSDAVSKAG